MKKTELLAVLLLIAGITLLSGCVKKSSESQTAPTGVQPVSDDQAAEVQENVAPAQEDSFAGWQTYKNDKYGYEIKYPGDWYMMKDPCCPPPPTAANFNNYSTKKAEYAAHQLEEKVYGFDILCLYEGKLSDIGEVKSYLDEGASHKYVKVNKSDAIMFSHNIYPNNPGEKVISYYIVDGTQGCRLTFSTKCPVCENILSTFKYTK